MALDKETGEKLWEYNVNAPIAQVGPLIGNGMLFVPTGKVQGQPKGQGQGSIVASTNGPNVHLYLSTDKAASNFIDLGKLRANNGNQNYNIPDRTDLSKYDMVLIWCKDFTVLFGSAELKM